MNGKPHEADKPRLIQHDDGSMTSRKPLNNDELQQWIKSPEGQAALAGDLNPYNGDGNK